MNNDFIIIEENINKSVYFSISKSNFNICLIYINATTTPIVIINVSSTQVMYFWATLNFNSAF